MDVIETAFTYNNNYNNYHTHPHAAKKNKCLIRNKMYFWVRIACNLLYIYDQAPYSSLSTLNNIIKPLEG